MLAYSRSVAVFGRFVSEWWNEPVDYAAQVQYFGKRAMAGAVQVLIGLGTGVNAVLSLVILLPFAGTFPSQFVVTLFSALQFLWAWAWCYRPWPPRWMSLMFIISADLGIAAVAVVEATWLLGLFALSAFGMISVYLMFFDGPKALAAHVVWILLSTTAFAALMGADTNFGGAAFTANMVTAIAPAASTPMGIQLAIWAMRREANDSVTDPLTGLLNRRGLNLHIGDLLRDKSAEGTKVTVMVLDLDRFKDVNDSFGHTIGDEVLVRCARRIKSAVRGSALVARIGGEEFAIVDLSEPGRDVQRDCARVMRAIAAPADHLITASAGVTGVPAANFTATGVEPVELLETMLERADHAMFDAKRKGGNRTMHLAPVDGAAEM